MYRALNKLDRELAAVEQQAIATKEQFERDRAHWDRLVQKRPVRKALTKLVESHQRG